MYYQTFLMEVVSSYAETMVMIYATHNSCIIISFSINIDASLINNISIIVMICTSIHVLSNVPYRSCFVLRRNNGDDSCDVQFMYYQTFLMAGIMSYVVKQ